MLKMFCDFCEKEISKNPIHVQLKEGEEIKKCHLHKDCLKAITGLLNTVKTVDRNKVMTIQSSKQEGAKETCAEVIESKEESRVVSASTINVDKECVNFKVKISSLPEVLTTAKPRNPINIQRVLLCFYKGMSVADIAAFTKLEYQTVFGYKNKYGCQEIAMRHQKPERLDTMINNVIEEFIKTGNAVSIANDFNTGEDKIRAIIERYTGF